MEHKLNIITKLTNFYIPIFGLFWITYYIYRRFIVDHLNYNLNSLVANHTILYGCLSIGFICIHLFVVKTIIESSLGYHETPTFPWVIKIIDYIYWKPLLYIYDVIAPKVPYSGTFFIWLTNTLNKLKRYQTFIDCAIIFDYIPRLLISISFLLDVFIYENLFHFYTVINFIIIPILYKIFLKLYVDFALRNYHIFEEFFTVKKTDRGTFEFIPINGYEYSEDLCKDWILLHDIQEIATTFQQVCVVFGKPIYLVSSTCYIISWAYVLIHYISIL
jgi:hypothetical protein